MSEYGLSEEFDAVKEQIKQINDSLNLLAEHPAITDIQKLITDLDWQVIKLKQKVESNIREVQEIISNHDHRITTIEKRRRDK